MIISINLVFIALLIGLVKNWTFGFAKNALCVDFCYTCGKSKQRTAKRVQIYYIMADWLFLGQFFHIHYTAYSPPGSQFQFEIKPMLVEHICLLSMAFTQTRVTRNWSLNNIAWIFQCTGWDWRVKPARNKIETCNS